MSPSFVRTYGRLVTSGMAISNYRVSERGQMALPSEARRRWDIADGGTVEIADLGNALIIVPAGRDGLQGILSQAITEAGGYTALVDQVVSDEPDLS